MNREGHTRRIQKVLWRVLALNALVAAAKIFYGLFSRSASMTADGFHSLSDGASNIIGLVGIRLSAQPQDTDHPYGHKKFETLFAMGIAAMLFLVAFGLVQKGISRIIEPVIPRVDFVSFAVMLITLAVNVSVMLYEYRRGKALQSDILVADSLHTRADIFTSCSVIAALIGVKAGVPVIDPIITLVIAAFIVHSAVGIVRQEAGILCDAVAIGDTGKVRGAALRIEGVKGCHKIRSRGRPDDVHLDLHVQVDGKMTIEESHRISHRIQEAIGEAFPQVTDVIVHMEPAGQSSGLNPPRLC